MKKIGLLAVVCAVLVGIAHAIGLNGTIINNPGLAFSQRYVFNLSNLDVNTVNAVATYSSAPFTTSNFTTGQTSSGTVAIINNTLLSTAAATNAITISSNAAGLGDSIVIPKLFKPGAHVFLAGRDWTYGATAALTAASVGAALATVPYLSVNVVGNVIYTTAPTGAYYNSIAMTTNRPTNLAISSPTFLGGVDAAVISVAGFQLQAGRDFTVGATSSLSAANLVTAINAKTLLNTFVVATSIGNAVTLRTRLAGSYYNFPLASSNVSASTVSAVAMTNGITPSWTLGSGAITIPSHGYTLALPILYVQGTSAAIGGLVTGTTYYAVPIDANTIGLSSTSVVAQTGTFISLTSSSTLNTQATYALNPLAYVTGSAGFAWQVSNDNVSWTNMAVTSVTYATPATTSWALGTIGYTYLGLNVTGPTSGALNLKVTAQSTYSN